MRGIEWPLLWPAVFTVQDTAGIASCVQQISYSHQVPGNRPIKFVAENYAPASVSGEGGREGGRCVCMSVSECVKCACVQYYSFLQTPSRKPEHQLLHME